MKIDILQNILKNQNIIFQLRLTHHLD